MKILPLVIEHWGVFELPGEPRWRSPTIPIQPIPKERLSRHVD